MEANEINVLAVAMFGNLEQVEDAEESGFAGELRGDVGQADGFNGVNFDSAFFHAIAGACKDVGTRPETDAAGDFASADAVAQAIGEGHGIT